MTYAGFGQLRMILMVGATAIVGVLVLPLFWSSSEQYRNRYQFNTQCQSNLKLLALSMQQYTIDYSGKWPLTASGNTRQNYGWVTAIKPYTSPHNDFVCPSEPNAPGTNPQQRGYTDYWYNSNFSGASVSTTRVPASTLLVGDGDGGSPASNARYAINHLPTTWSGANPARRHFNGGAFYKPGGAYYVFADGHAKWLQPEYITTVPPTQGNATFALR